MTFLYSGFLVRRADTQITWVLLAVSGSMCAESKCIGFMFMEFPVLFKFLPYSKKIGFTCFLA